MLDCAKFCGTGIDGRDKNYELQLYVCSYIPKHDVMGIDKKRRAFSICKWNVAFFICPWRPYLKHIMHKGYNCSVMVKMWFTSIASQQAVWVLILIFHWQLIRYLRQLFSQSSLLTRSINTNREYPATKAEINCRFELKKKTVVRIFVSSQPSI